MPSLLNGTLARGGMIVSGWIFEAVENLFRLDLQRGRSLDRPKLTVS
jgi:hypothetical protein